MTRGRGPTATGPRCCAPVDIRPGIVLDPFFGTGTVGLVAQEHGRDWVGIELNPAYAEFARHRIATSEPALQEAA
jgi:site-specific DNA-methyltransferase (adenine-specific)